MATKIHCKYFIERKKRNCCLIANPNTGYCGEHVLAVTDLSNNLGVDVCRVPCPLDARHTCWARNVDKHVRKCKKRQCVVQAYHSPHINSGLPDLVGDENNQIELAEVTANNVPREEVTTLIGKVGRLFHKHRPTIQEETLFHPVFDGAFNDPQNGEKALKHIRQEASILGHMEGAGLLTDDTIYVDFGAGKGQMSYWLARALEGRAQVLAVDRFTVRHKYDRRQDFENKSSVTRLKIDIEDLNLGKVACVAESDLAVVGYSKHLCGPATDLCLRCVVNTLPDGKTDDNPPATDKPPATDNPPATDKPTTMNGEKCRSRLKGLVLALCCHHKGNWHNYVGKQFFHENGLKARDYQIIQSLSSWATCGFRQGSKRGYPANDDVTDEVVLDDGEWAPAARAEIGRQCKRLIDVGRIHYLEERGYHTALKLYVDSSVSLENVLMIVTPHPR